MWKDGAFVDGGRLGSPGRHKREDWIRLIGEKPSANPGDLEATMKSLSRVEIDLGRASSDDSWPNLPLTLDDLKWLNEDRQKRPSVKKRQNPRQLKWSMWSTFNNPPPVPTSGQMGWSLMQD